MKTFIPTAIASLMTLAIGLGSAQQYIVNYHYLGGTACSGNYTTLSVSPAACSSGLGDFGDRPYGFLSGQNATHYFISRCSDANCQTNCDDGYQIKTGCIIYPGEDPVYPGEADYIAIVDSVPSIPSGYTVTYRYGAEGCDENDLWSITAYDHVCRTIRGQSLGYFCNATTASQSGCEANATVYSNPTGTCLSQDGRSTRYFCNQGTTYSCSIDFDCRPFAQDYNFAQCSNSQCACKPGFSGSATSSDQCRCEGTVVYTNGQAGCLTSGQCTADRVDLCSGFTQDYNFIQCSNGTCACKASFNGSATASDKCRCDGTVNWSNGVPTCSQ